MNARLWTALAFAALTTAIPVEAATRSAQEAQIALCIRKAANGKPWLEMTLWGLRDQEGGWIGAEVANSDGSHDLGPLQINSWWVSRISASTGRPTDRIRWWLIHDPCFNVEVARWIFLTGLATAGGYWQAVGVYHSPTGWRQRRYVRGVVRHLSRRFGPDVFAPQQRPAVPAKVIAE
jgi:hypothetical protein